MGQQRLLEVLPRHCFLCRIKHISVGSGLHRTRSVQAEAHGDSPEAFEAAMDTMDDRSHCTLLPSGMVHCIYGMGDANDEET